MSPKIVCLLVYYIKFQFREHYKITNTIANMNIPDQVLENMSSQWIKADIKILVYLNKIVCYEAYLIILSSLLCNRIICHNLEYEEGLGFGLYNWNLYTIA